MCAPVDHKLEQTRTRGRETGVSFPSSPASSFFFFFLTIAIVFRNQTGFISLYCTASSHGLLLLLLLIFPSFILLLFLSLRVNSSTFLTTLLDGT